MIATRHRILNHPLASLPVNLAVLAFLAILLNGLPMHSRGIAAAEQEAATKVVHVVINYGDGVERHYTQIAWKPGLTGIDALLAVSTHVRGVPVKVRGRGETAFVLSIDGLANQGDGGRNWIYRVNGEVGERSAGVVELAEQARLEWRFETYP